MGEVIRVDFRRRRTGRPTTWDCYAYSLTGASAEIYLFNQDLLGCESFSRDLGSKRYVYCVPNQPGAGVLWLVAGRHTNSPDWAFTSELP